MSTPTLAEYTKTQAPLPGESDFEFRARCMRQLWALLTPGPTGSPWAPPPVTATANGASVPATGTTAVGSPSVPPTQSTDDLTDWGPVNLVALEPPPPTALLRRTDDFCLLYAGVTHAFIGSSGSGKTWATLLACVGEIRKANRVMFIDFEDDARFVVNRLLQMGLTIEEIGEYFTYIRPYTPLDGSRKAKLKLIINEARDTNKPYTLVVLDGVTPIMTMHRWKINDAEGASAFIIMYPQWFAKLGPAVIYVDHPSRNGDGTEATGSFYKEAGAYVTYVFEKVTPFTAGQHGVTNVFCKKDKPGAINENHPNIESKQVRFVGVLHGDSDSTTKQIRVWIDPPGLAGPSRSASSAGSTKSGPSLKDIMEHAYKLQMNHGGMSARSLRAAAGGNTRATEDKIYRLINDGYLVKNDGKDKSKSLTTNNAKHLPGVNPLAYLDEFSDTSPDSSPI